MPTTFFYNDDNGQTQGPYNLQGLQELADQGIITLETPLATDSGRTGLAGQIPGLRFPERKKTSPIPHASHSEEELFCTNCGNSVSERAVACMSCGAEPTGHRKFCRQCGAGVTAEQVVCTKCGSKIKSPAFQTVQVVKAQAQQTTKSGFLWLFDFAFRDIRLHIIILWICRITYALCWIVAIIYGLVLTIGVAGATFFAASQVRVQDAPLAPLAPLTVLLAILTILAIWLSVLLTMFYIRVCLEWFIIVIDWMVETTKAARIYIAEKSGHEE